jgi:glycosyltransferase involved in cell wall biosynthesis
MINWHRLVKPLRESSQPFSDRDFFKLVYNLCTRMSIEYQPEGRPFRVADQDPRQFTVPTARDPQRPRVGLFCDAPNHISGVATTLKQWTKEANQRDLSLHVLHAGSEPFLRDAVCFPPVGTLELDAYDGLSLHVPRVSDVLAFARQEAFDVVHVSTPGPMGLLGLRVARDLRVPVCGTYHTDFPRYAVKLTGDGYMEEVTWEFMRWFYGQLHMVAAPSQATANDLAEHGLDPNRLMVVGRGVNCEQFSPRHRSEALRCSWGADKPVKLLYVGRVSREKNLPCLVEAFKQLCAVRSDTALVGVGDGPYLDEMKRELAGLPVVFTGFQQGAALAEIYASCDLFVFPSETDTLGVVVLEAQASRVPVVVAGQGGPRHCMQDGVTGVVLEEMAPDSLARTVAELVSEPESLRGMADAALAYAKTMTLENSFDVFWELHLSCMEMAQAESIVALS